MPAPPPFVALEIAASGPDPERDAIVAVAAARFTRGRVRETFLATVRPEVDPPFADGRDRVEGRDAAKSPEGDDVLAGTAGPAGMPGDAGAAMVDVPVEDALEALGDFVGRDVVVGHDLARVLRLARRHGALTRAAGYDLAELADVVVPASRDLSLDELLGLVREPETDACVARTPLARAVAQGGLFLGLLERMRRIDPGVLGAIAALAPAVGWGLAPVFRFAAQSAPPGAPHEPADAVPAPLVRASRFMPVDADVLEALIAPGGRLTETMPGFEDRAGQRAMLRAVCGAFNRGDNLLVEAGTGTGKSLAYLLPAAQWALANGRPVVVATHTITLQDQLVHKDLPLARGLLGADLRACVLKGRANYVCRTRLDALAARDDLGLDGARAAARILVWARATSTGDRSELGLGVDESRLWRSVSAEGDSCTAETCPHARLGSCFVHRARARAEGSHVVVVNHALLVSDARVDNRLLPRHGHLVIDEAHHLEAVATDALGFSASRQRVRDAVAATELAGERGLLVRVAATIAASGLDERTRAAVWETVTALRSLAGRAALDAETLFARLADCLASEATGPDVRLTDALRARPEWLPVETAWDALRGKARDLRSGFVRLAQGIEAAGDLAAGGAALATDLSSAARELADVDQGLERVVARPDPNDIVWASRGDTDRIAVHLAPLFVGTALSRWLFEDKETLVLTSATLRAGEDFAFLRDRLSVPDAEELVVDSPFDFARAALVYVPTDIPAPTEAGYQDALDGAIVGLAAALGGRALVLYTSYSGLRETYHRIRAPLGAAGISVLGQGLDGPQHRLLEGLRDPGRRTVLLGTRSFWEGVDVPGEALSCVVMARLPFDVPTDPVFAARAETVDEPFREYAVPMAVLRFRQGFGRLIRTRSDRGVFAVLDGRVRSRSYGHMFLSALPPCRVERGPLGDLAIVARRFLRGEMDETDESGAAVSRRRDEDGNGGGNP